MGADGPFIEHDDPVFRKCADRKFPMERMADLADDEDLERTLKDMRHFRRDDHPAARQAHHPIHFHGLFAQPVSQPATGIFTLLPFIIVCFACVAIVYGIAAGLMANAATLIYLNAGTLGNAFRLRDVWALVQKHHMFNFLYRFNDGPNNFEGNAYTPTFFADGSGKNTARLNFSFCNEKTIEEGIARLGVAVKRFITAKGRTAAV